MEWLYYCVAISSDEAEYISAATACMRASHLHMLIYDLKYLGTFKYDGDNMDYEPAWIIIDNKAAISTAKYNKDTAGNRHVAQQIHYASHFYYCWKFVAASLLNHLFGLFR